MFILGISLELAGCWNPTQWACGWLTHVTVTGSHSSRLASREQRNPGREARSLVLESEQRINKQLSAQCGVHYVDSEIGRVPTGSLASQGMCQSWLTPHCPARPSGAARCHPACSNLFFLFPGSFRSQHPFWCAEVSGFLVNYCVCTFPNTPASSHALQGRVLSNPHS